MSTNLHDMYIFFANLKYANKLLKHMSRDYICICLLWHSNWCDWNLRFSRLLKSGRGRSQTSKVGKTNACPWLLKGQRVLSVRHPIIHSNPWDKILLCYTVNCGNQGKLVPCIPRMEKNSTQRWQIYQLMHNSMQALPFTNISHCLAQQLHYRFRQNSKA